MEERKIKDVPESLLVKAIKTVPVTPTRFQLTMVARGLLYDEHTHPDEKRQYVVACGNEGVLAFYNLAFEYVFSGGFRVNNSASGFRFPDFLDGVSKGAAYENATKPMRPYIIEVDQRDNVKPALKDLRGSLLDRWIEDGYEPHSALFWYYGDSPTISLGSEFVLAPDSPRLIFFLNKREEMEDWLTFLEQFREKREEIEDWFIGLEQECAK
jgi:hypothetical protein